MKFQIYILLVFFTIIPLFGFGQELTISGQVTDAENQPISYANVILMQKDSTIVKGVSTNNNGFFELNRVENGSYIIKISFIGFKDFTQNLSVESDIDLNTIILEEVIEDLNEVSITVNKPTLKREADRLVFNVEKTALSEGNMLQVLKSTPGVLVIGDDIKVKNTNPTVYINDRKVNLSSSELTQLLSGSSATIVKSVEVITNPSAKYDAESGVVINIVMSKNLATGYSGSLFTNYTQGVYPRYNVGTNQFFKNEKINFNINYNYNKDKINRESDDTINYFENNNVDEIWNSLTDRNTWSETHSTNINFDYFINNNNTLSLSSNGLYMPYFKYKINNNTYITDQNQNALSRFEANNISKDNKYNFAFDLDYVHKLSKGQLAFNSHYTIYNYDRFQKVISDYYNANNTFLNTTAFNTDANQDTKIFASKLDYNLPVNENSNFEAGLKYSKIKTESDIMQFDVDTNTGTQQLDPQNSDAFHYDEQIFAAYTNYSLDTDNWSLSFGLRAEQTNTEGISESLAVTNKQDYLEWFPNASLLHRFSNNFNLYTNYKRSISRPGYADLNPFRFFLNDNYIVVGNPNLTPTFVDHFTVGSSFLEHFTIEAYYKNLDGNISEIPRQNNTTNVIEYTSVNFDKTVEFGFDFAVDFYLTENWNTYFVTSFYNIEEETNFGNGFVKQDQWSNYSMLSNNVSFLKDQSLNVYFTLIYASKNLQGFQRVDDRLVSDLSITKSILNKKGMLSLSISDLFNTQDFDIETKYENQFSTNHLNFDNRYIKLGFRYKFGNTKLQTNARTKELEERERLEKKQ